MHSTENIQAIATAELNSYLEIPGGTSVVSRIVPNLTPIVPRAIVVERFGFTRNSSNTPYIVYKVNGRRCCTFVKRKFFTSLIQKLLKIKYGITEKLTSIKKSEYGGINFKAAHIADYIPDVYVNIFLARYNQVALAHTPMQSVRTCECLDMFDMCVHQVASVLEEHISS